MKTNTVVQEAIEKLTEKRNEFTPEINDYENGIVSAFNDALRILKESLPKEREQKEQFAIESIKADREDAAEKAKSTIKCSETDYCPCYGSSDCYAKYASIDKSSITDRPLPTFKQ